MEQEVNSVELTVAEIEDIRKKITDPTSMFWDYVKFAREVIKAHEEKKSNS